jgi:hypothetical protein
MVGRCRVLGRRDADADADANASVAASLPWGERREEGFGCGLFGCAVKPMMAGGHEAA